MAAMTDLSLAKRAWMKAVDQAPPECCWSAELVKKRLIEAQRVVQVTAGRVGPRVYGNAMPTPVKDDLERWFERMAEREQLEQEAREHNRTPFRPTLEQATQADGAIWWQSRYLVGTPFDEGPDRGPLAMLNLFLAARQTGVTFPEAVKARKLPVSSAYRERDDALTVIAIGLIRDRVPTGAVEAEPAVEAKPVLTPDWWWQVDLLMNDASETVEVRLRMADILIETMVKTDEFGGRSLGKSLTYAEYRGRCTYLQRVLRDREGLSDVSSVS